MNDDKDLHITLPCKIGETYWVIEDVCCFGLCSENNCGFCDDGECDREPTAVGYELTGDTTLYTLTHNKFYKTREEAKKALEERHK